MDLRYLEKEWKGKSELKRQNGHVFNFGGTFQFSIPHLEGI